MGDHFPFTMILAVIVGFALGTVGRILDWDGVTLTTGYLVGIFLGMAFVILNPPPSRTR